jgi:helicase MOV-10
MAPSFNMPQSHHGNTVKDNLSRLVAVPNIVPRTKSSVSPGFSTSTVAEPQVSSETGKHAILRSSGTSDTSQSDFVNNSWEYDVYATPFAPPALRSINTETATIFPTVPRHQIDFEQYVHSFVGTSFIPTPYTEAEQSLGLSAADSLRPATALDEFIYLQHFSRVAAIECAAKEGQNETYAMYRVPLRQSPSAGGLWSLSVPGIREDSPHIEMGDVLQIRQLYVDGAGAIMPMPVYVNDDQYWYKGNPSVSFKSWTGIQHDGAVFGINRAQETVYIKADGLGFPDPSIPPMPMFANVVIPLKFNIIRSQRRALVHLSSELKHISLALRTDASGSLENHFGESPGTKYATLQRETAEATSGDHRNDWSLRMLFPEESHGKLQTTLRKVPHRELYDKAINYEQAHAVNGICNNTYGVLPYLISGPPGTGKTKTLVETAMQLLETSDVKHLLICAPSEAAADTIALRLKSYLSRKQLFRLNRPGRADNEVPRELLQYCHIENDMFSLPSFKDLMAFDIVVASCQDASILAEARMTNNDLWTMQKAMFSAFNPREEMPTPPLHWTALLIDEAAQATELDVLPAISVVCPPSTYPEKSPQPRFVMAGDENQLGPRTASRDTRVTMSLFARLFKRPLYNDHPLSRSKVKPSSGPPVLKRSMLPITYPPFTLLIRNYRSHPAILSVPSAIFYQNTLIPEVVIPNTPLQQSDIWRGRRWPVLFVPHDGTDEIERDGGGWYNISEANIACDIAQTLIYSSSVKQPDICIMSPFAAQVRLMRSLIRSSKYGNGSGLWDVNIGPLEAFQGLEKRVVILCTTRTRKRFLAKDNSMGVGIIGEKRKMNVALTRAKEALVVIGNPEVLEQDANWRQWMAYCWRNGLVRDDEGIWAGCKNEFGVPKFGVLERALMAKEDQGKANGRVLGAGHETNEDYDAWVESLREALEEDDEEVEGEEYEETEEAEYAP